MTSTTTERHVDALIEACDRAPSELALFEEVSTRLAEILPFDGAAWFATDPATVLGTTVRIENVESGHCESFWERECGVEDVILFRDVARSPLGIGSLYEATDHHPTRSARYREFLSPQGYGDELRAAFRLGSTTWGVVDLFRDKARGEFTAQEREQVRRIAPAVGTALRRFVAASAATAGAESGPGTALFDADSRIVSLDDCARALFEELGGTGWAERPLPMTGVYAVVARATAVAEGRDRGPAAARLRSPAGRWLALHASCLRSTDGHGGLTALTIEPAKSAQVAPIIVEAYSLTVREQQITSAVARGLSNQEIAAQLFLSPHTVRDHLKAVFAKVGVGTRGELVAKLFAEHYASPLHQAYDHVDR